MKKFKLLVIKYINLKCYLKIIKYFFSYLNAFHSENFVHKINSEVKEKHLRSSSSHLKKIIVNQYLHFYLTMSSLQNTLGFYYLYQEHHITTFQVEERIQKEKKQLRHKHSGYPTSSI